MPKFKKAFFVSFHGDDPSEETRKPFFSQTTGLYDKYTIKMHTDKKRKKIFNSSMPYIRLNFPIGTNKTELLSTKMGMYTNERLNLEYRENNLKIAKRILANGLTGIEPYSIIYIAAHGFYKNCIVQCLKDETFNKTYNLFLGSELIASLFNQCIPLFAHSNIQFHLLICKPEIFAQNFTEDLNSFGFKKISVICYNTNGIYVAEDSLSNHDFQMADYFSQPKYRAIQEGKMNNSNYKAKESNKIVFHNYKGNVEELEYRDFKKIIFNVNFLYSTDYVLLTEVQEELILFQNIIFQSIASYLIDYESKKVPRYKQQRERAEVFGNNVLRIKFEEILSSDQLNIDSFAKQIVYEVKQYATEAGEYKQFKKIFNNHGVNVDEKNDMFYLMKGLKQFRDLNPHIFLPFLNSIYNLLPNIEFNSKENKKIFLNAIKNIKFI